MSKDKKNVPTAWLAEKAANYRFLQQEEMHSERARSYRHMAWAFELVLEEWWKPVPPSPIVEAMNKLMDNDGLTPEAVTLIKMAIEAQETGKMPPLPITLQPMPEEMNICVGNGGAGSGCGRLRQGQDTPALCVTAWSYLRRHLMPHTKPKSNGTKSHEHQQRRARRTDSCQQQGHPSLTQRHGEQAHHASPHTGRKICHHVWRKASIR